MPGIQRGSLNSPEGPLPRIAPGDFVERAILGGKPRVWGPFPLKSGADAPQLGGISARTGHARQTSQSALTQQLID